MTQFLDDKQVAECKQELSDFFQAHSIRFLPTDYRHPLTEIFQKFWDDNPDASRYAVKAEMYRRTAEYISPEIFDHSPFFFFTGLMPPDWEVNQSVPAFFLREHTQPYTDMESLKKYGKFFQNGLGWAGLTDPWHYCPDYSYIIQNGLKGICQNIQNERLKAQNNDEREFLDAAQAGILALKTVADKFAETAKRALKAPNLTPEQRHNWTLIADAASRIPWNPPQNFYEGLETLLFIKEVTNGFEGIHIDIVGHPDRQLEHLYKKDIEEKRITKDEAFTLIRLFLLVNDCKQDNHENFDDATQSKRPDDDNPKRRPLAVVDEINATMTLGGCHEDGTPVCEELTLMFLKAHRMDDLFFPKPLCRFSANSSREYLREINENFLNSRSVLALVNDDAIIPAQVAAGKSLQDARRYQVGGCWEVTIEGREDSSGVTTYFNLAKLMELTVNPPQELADDLWGLDSANSFEDVIQAFLHNLDTVITARCKAISINGPAILQSNPCPLFSAMLADCIQNHTDYTRGGGRYNPHANPCFAFANVVDSLMAIKTLCFGQKPVCSLKDIITAVKNDWKDAEDIRKQALHAPFWGDNQTETNQVAQRIYNALAHMGEGIPNERGGKWQTAFYVYREMIPFAQLTGATPDGRHAGEWVAQGITPSRLHPLNALTDACLALASLDPASVPGNRLFDLNLPLNASTHESMQAFETTAAQMGIGMLQLNCISREQLLDAQRHPEKHENLIVRLCGYSARFVTLPRLWQDEFISRAINA